MSAKFLIFVLVLFFCLPVFGQVKKDDKKTDEKKQEHVATQKKLEKLLSSITARTKKQADSTTASLDNIEIDGLIIDQSRTKIGHEFYEYFYNLWQAPEKIRDYTIFIFEKADPRFGSRISISVDDWTIYQSMLKPRSVEIEEAAKVGVQRTLQFLYRYDRDKRQLAGEDMVGSGIF